MTWVMFGDLRVVRITQEEIREAFIAQREEMMVFRVGQGSLAADLMRLGAAFRIDDRYLAAQGIAVFDATERDLDLFGQAWRLVIEPEGGCKCAIDV